MLFIILITIFNLSCGGGSKVTTSTKRDNIVKVNNSNDFKTKDSGFKILTDDEESADD